MSGNMKDYQALLRLHHRREYYPITRMDWHELNESMKESIFNTVSFQAFAVSTYWNKFIRAVGEGMFGWLIRVGQ